jgi:hypothetical protein
MALALVLWVLVIGAAILTLGVLVAIQEQRASGAERSFEHGFTDAELALDAALDSLNPAELRLLLPGPFDSLTVGGTLGTGGAPWRGTVRRLDRTSFLVEVVAGPPHAEVRLGRLLQPRGPDVAVSAALSTGGSVVLGPGTIVSGRDSTPAGTDCPGPDSAVAGVAAASASLLPGSTVDGSPPVILRLSAGAGLTPDDSATFERLAGQATVLLGGGTFGTFPATVGTACNVQAPTNWGSPSDPGSPCGAYRPAVHVSGDLSLVAGEGQGILLVDGDLRVLGQYRFDGLVLVRGSLEIGTPAVFSGFVAAGAVGAPTQPAVGLELRYSKCKYRNALISSARLSPLRSRSWKRLF